jgi:hypothetical protein
LIYDRQHNLIIYDVVNPALFCNVVPGAFPLVNGHVAAPVNLLNLQRLRSLGLPVFRWLDDNYDWPHSPCVDFDKKTFECQKDRACFLTAHPRAYDLSDPGTGKTLTALWSADALMTEYSRMGQRVRAIIAATLSTLDDTWARELTTHFLGRRTFAILHGTADKREKELARDVDFYIINHDGLKTGVYRGNRNQLVFDGFAAALEKRNDIRIAIVDEIGMYRNSSTLRHRIGRRLLSSRDYFWGLTGTPIPQSPEDAHGVRKLKDPLWPETKASWRSKVMVQLNENLWRPKPSAAQTVAETLTPAIRYPFSDETVPSMLPPDLRKVELTPEQNKLLRELKRELYVQFKDGGEIEAINEAAARTKFLQIMAGVVYDSNHKEHALPCSPRLQALKEAIFETQQKVIVFASFTSVVHMLYEFINEHVRPASFVIGATSKDQRKDLFTRLRNSPDLQVLVADPVPISHGLNFPQADTVIWYTATDKADSYEQGNQRIRRPGQKFPQRIIQIYSSPVEREIFHRLDNSLSLQGAMLKLIEDRK